MSKRNKAEQQAALAPVVLAPVVEDTQPEVVVEATPRILEDLRPQEEDRSPEEIADDAEIDAQIALPASVVQRKYKLKYKARARANGERSKAAKRSTWDWLAVELAAACLDEKSKLRVDEFLAILSANGVDHAKWTNRAPGWEGRLRMTGSLALRRVLAESGELFFPDGEQKPVPEEELVRLRAKFDI
jgi:hypothetical protein